MVTWFLIISLVVVGGPGITSVTIPGYETEEDCQLAYQEMYRNYYKQNQAYWSYSCLRGPKLELDKP